MLGHTVQFKRILLPSFDISYLQGNSNSQAEFSEGEVLAKLQRKEIYRRTRRKDGPIKGYRDTGDVGHRLTFIRRGQAYSGYGEPVCIRACTNKSQVMVTFLLLGILTPIQEITHSIAFSGRRRKPNNRDQTMRRSHVGHGQERGKGQATHRQMVPAKEEGT